MSDNYYHLALFQAVGVFAEETREIYKIKNKKF